MARSVSSTSWQRGFAESTPTPSWADESKYISENGERAHYAVPNPREKATSTVANEFGFTSLRSWPGVYNGTEGLQTNPPWWKPSSEVDVLICGAGPFGLAMALTLSRQGITCRIVDKAEGPCHSGRADALQPRSLEFLQAWGLGHEFTNEGPAINELIMHRNGSKMTHSYVLERDSRFRGNSVATQGQIEKIMIRDLARHKVLVERRTTVTNFEVSADPSKSHPVTATIARSRGGEVETIQAKYLVGADGAASRIRELLGTPFDGLRTDCFWSIMDVPVKTDYPHILDFSIVCSTEHGATIMVPREQGVTRIYVQVPPGKAAQVAATRRQNRENSSVVGETQVHEHGITPDEVLEQYRRIMSPWKVDFAGPMSWFAVWRVNERVARSFSTRDQRVHIGGDAAHVHSVLGAFGMNSSLYDAANLSWKLGLCVRGAADPLTLLSTYDTERRLYANRVIRFSGAFMRFICNLDLPLASLRGAGEGLEVHDEIPLALGATNQEAGKWLGGFFGRMPKFMTGLGIPIVDTVLTSNIAGAHGASPVNLLNGVRAPDTRVCFSADNTSYLYDAMMGVGKFHILLFASDLQGAVRAKIAHFSTQGLVPGGFFDRFGGRERFNVVLVVKALPHEADELLGGHDLQNLRGVATVVYDDRAPDEDVHNTYGVNHARGAVVVIRPDLLVGASAWPEDSKSITEYLSTFLITDKPQAKVAFKGSHSSTEENRKVIEVN